MGGGREVEGGGQVGGVGRFMERREWGVAWGVWGREGCEGGGRG